MNSRETERLRSTLLRQAEEEKERSLSDPSWARPETLSIHYICFQKMSLPVRKLFEAHYRHLKKITVNNCDLRTFENFPSLPDLTEVNAAQNSMRGSFEFIVKNRGLTYIDVSDNFIADVKRFEPLSLLKDISIYAKGNPFLKLGVTATKDSVFSKLKCYGVVLLKEPRKCEGNVQEKSEDQAKNVMSESEQKKNMDEFSDFSEQSGNPFASQKQHRPFLQRVRPLLQNEHAISHGNLLRLIHRSTNVSELLRGTEISELPNFSIELGAGNELNIAGDEEDDDEEDELLEELEEDEEMELFDEIDSYGEDEENSMSM